MTKFIEKLFDNEYIAYLIKKDVLQKKVFKNILGKFKISRLNSNFFTFGNINSLFSQKYNVDLSKKINILKDYIIFSYPLYNIKNKHVGYIVFAKPFNKIKVLKELQNSYKHKILFLIIFYVMGVITIFSIYLYFILHKKAYNDSLTEVLNRHGCKAKIKSLKKYSLLIIDIDHFKKINDTYGHDIGDEILKEIANVVRKVIRKSDIFCRWGGEEFVIILPDTNIKDAKKVAEKIRNIIAHSEFTKGLKVTVSIGVSEKIEDFETTFKQADINLYKAKQSGRNRVV
jgi:diguanylate cyclase (GGDEF)-like protein